MSAVMTVKDGSLGILIVHNPPKHVLDEGLFRDMQTAFYGLNSDPDVNAIIFKGKGSIFLAGADVNLILGLAREKDRGKASGLLAGLHKFLLDIDRSDKMIIFAVNGYCLGGGLELSLAGDFIIATGNAQFGYPEIELGIMPGLGGTQRTPRRIGSKSALELIFRGKEFISADKAKKFGLIDEVIKGDFVEGIKTFVAKIQKEGLPPRKDGVSADEDGLSEDFINNLVKGRPKAAVDAIVKAVKTGMNQDLETALLETEVNCFLDVLFSSDALEGLSAFVEKRAPKFKEIFGEEPKKTDNDVKPESGQDAAIKTEEDPKILPWQKEEHIMIRGMISEFLEKEVENGKRDGVPVISWMEENGRIPEELIKKMAELQFFGIGFPEEYGGSGLGTIGKCILMEELCRVYASLAVMVGAHLGLACEAVNLYGNEDQKQRYLVPGIKGEKIGAFATTEPGVGSDVAGIRTTAYAVDGGYRLNGAKQFITNGDIAAFIIVFAKMKELLGEIDEMERWDLANPNVHKSHQKALTAFIVDTKSEGFTVSEPAKKMGIHGSRTNSFTLENVFVPKENVLGIVGDGFKEVMNVFNHSRITLAGGCIGAIRAALQKALDYSKSCNTFGQAIWNYQTIQNYLAEMETMRYSLEPMVYQTAWLADKGEDIRKEAAIVKYYGSECAFKAVDMSLQIHGGSGFMEEYDIARMCRDVRVIRIFEGTSEIQRLLIAKEILKKAL